MTDTEIYNLGEKTRKQNFCSRFTREYGCTSDKFPGSRCPMYKSCRHTDEWYNGCEKTGYELGFLDGFKAGYKKGQDSMSDYVIELQHTAYND